MENSLRFTTALMVVLPLLVGCAGSYERQTRSSLDARPRPAPRGEDRDSPETPSTRFDGSIDGYVGYAVEHNPELRAQYAEWEASVDGIDAMRALPDPQLRYTLYVRHIETRVGPQRHKFGFTQAFPWPTELTAGAASASLAAQSAERRLDAGTLNVVRRVATAYWRIWLVDRTKEVLGDQKKLLDAVEEAARARLEVGNVSLADLTQVSLSRSRIVDSLQGLDEQRRQHEARLREALSVTSATELPIRADEPRVMLPGEREAALRDAARNNPRVTSLELMARSKEEAADRAFAEGLPGFSLGLDWIETGAAQNAGVPDSGKDAVQIHFGVSVPLWRHVYTAKEAKAHSESRALLARRDAAEDDAVAATDTALSEVRDAFRRVRLYRDTLLPQAETVIESALGGYQVGEVSLPSVLIAQRDLLELQLALLRAQADHAIAWAQLEEIVGRKIRAGEGA